MPKTRLGFVAAGLLAGHPALKCPHCGREGIIATDLRSAVAVGLWAALGLAIVMPPALAGLATSIRLLLVAAGVCAVLLLQWLLTPYLLRLRRPEAGEPLHTVEPPSSH